MLRQSVLFTRSVRLVSSSRTNRITSVVSTSSLEQNARIASTSRRFFAQDAAAAKPSGDKSNVFEVNEDKVKKLTTEILSLNLMEIVMLVNIMEKQLGLGDVRSMVQASAGAAPAGAAAGKKGADKKEAAPAAPVKSVFELKLDSFEAGDKIKVIKQVREITGLGLKEAKDLVEGAPKVLMKEVTKEQGEQLVEKLKVAGAKASLV